MARKNVPARGLLDRSAASDLWKNTLSQIPSVYGRLTYLAGLRNINTGRYEHHGLALIFSQKEADEALRQSHIKAFAEWIGFTLEQQKADLDLYLSDQEEMKRRVLENWLQLQPYKALIPTSAAGAERALFLADLDALLTLLKNETGASVPDPDA